MAKFKTVMIFRSVANGWSEVWYQELGAIVDGVAPARNVAGQRQFLLGAHAAVEAIRISSVDRPFKSYLFGVKLDWNSQTPVADTSWNTIYARADDVTKVYHRIIQLRGIPDAWIERAAISGEIDVNIGPVTGPLARYIASLKQNGFLFRQRDQAGAAGTEIVVTAFGKEVGTNRLTVTAAGVAVAINGYVTIKGAQGFGAAETTRGRHKVISNNGAMLVLATVVDEDVVPIAWTGGTVRLYLVGYFGPDTATPIRASHRDTGRRFFVTRGRQSRRAT